MRRTRFNKEFNILACDPSLAAWGYAVIDLEGNILDADCIKTKKENKKRGIFKGDDNVRRIDELLDVFMQIIENYHINYIVSELQHGSQNSSAAIGIGATTAILQTISRCNKIGIEWFYERDIKKFLFNRESVTKTEMIEKIKTKLNVNWCNIKYKNEAIADALGIYLTALDKSSALKLFIKTRKDDANDY